MQTQVQNTMAGTSEMAALMTVPAGIFLFSTSTEKSTYGFLSTGVRSFIGYIMTLNLIPIKNSALLRQPQDFYLSPDFAEKYKNAHFPMGYKIIRFFSPPLLSFQLVISAYHSIKMLLQKRSLSLRSKHFFAVLFPEVHVGTTINKRSSQSILTQL